MKKILLLYKQSTHERLKDEAKRQTLLREEFVSVSDLIRQYINEGLKKHLNYKAK